MGIFTRFRDIISSNINAMLDAAEDPEKMIRLMIQEMEETLIEMKASCASSLAGRSRLQREARDLDAKVEKWEANAKLAVAKGREDLAREALLEKRQLRDQLDALERELAASEELVQSHQDQIAELEQKLVNAREKQRLLVQRHQQAKQKYQAQSQIRHMEVGEGPLRFDEFETRIERMEAAAGSIRTPAKPNLAQEFDALAKDDEIEKELDRLKKEANPTA